MPKELVCAILVAPVSTKWNTSILKKRKKKVVLNKLFYMYEVFFPREYKSINFEVSAIYLKFLLK